MVKYNPTMQGLPDNVSYNVYDVKELGFTVEPLRCLNRKCKDPIGYVIPMFASVGDAMCEYCGEFQDGLPDDRNK